MIIDESEESDAPQAPRDGPILCDLTRQRLGRHLKALYEPIIDETLDPRLAELMQQLNVDRGL